MRLTFLFYISILIICGCSNNTQTDKNILNVGVLFSQTGDQSVSEAALKDAVLMAIEEINNDGGLLGKQINPIVIDPESVDNSYYFQTTQLLSKQNASVIFGTWSLNSRSSVAKALQKYNGILFSPANYEGNETSGNIVCIGATPNQQIDPAIKYLIKTNKRFYLLGNNSTYSRNINSIIRSKLIESGISNALIVDRYISNDQAQLTQVVNDIKRFSIKGNGCVINSISGETSLAFYKEFTNQGLSSISCPVMNLSVGEEEFRNLHSEFLTGHLFAKNYFQTVDSDKNIRFASNYKLYCAINELPGGIDRVTSDGICWAYTSVMLWKKAVEKAQSFDNAKVKAALNSLEYNSPAGIVRMHSSNLHLAKPAFIGESKSDGQVEILWKSDTLIEPIILKKNTPNKQSGVAENEIASKGG